MAMKKIFLHPPAEKDWKFFSFFQDGKPRKLSDWAKEGGTRAGLIGGVNRHIFFRTEDLDEVHAYVAEVKGLLGKNKHFSNDSSVTLQAIALFLEARQRKPSLSISAFLSETAEQKVSLFYSFPFLDLVDLQLAIPEIPIVPIKLGRFLLGGEYLRREVLKRFPEAEELGIEKSPSLVLACPELNINLLPLKEYLGETAPDSYYSMAMQNVEEKVLDELSATQAVASAMVGDAMVVEHLRRYPNLVRYVSFSGGYTTSYTLLPSRSGLPTTSSFATFPALFESLNLNSYPLSESSNFTSIDQTVFTFISVMFKGFRFAVEEMFSDAFFQYIMALDLLLGGGSDNNNNIQRRCAVIRMYSGDSPISFSSAKESAKKLYDVRSRYAHQARQPSKHDLEEVQFFCSEVAKVLFLFRTSLISNADLKTQVDSYNKWVKALDFLAATHEADQVPTLSQLQACYLR